MNWTIIKEVIARAYKYMRIYLCSALRIKFFERGDKRQMTEEGGQYKLRILVLRRTTFTPRFALRATQGRQDDAGCQLWIFYHEGTKTFLISRWVPCCRAKPLPTTCRGKEETSRG